MVHYTEKNVYESAPLFPCSGNSVCSTGDRLRRLYAYGILAIQRMELFLRYDAKVNC